MEKDDIHNGEVTEIDGKLVIRIAEFTDTDIFYQKLEEYIPDKTEVIKELRDKEQEIFNNPNIKQHFENGTLEDPHRDSYRYGFDSRKRSNWITARLNWVRSKKQQRKIFFKCPIPELYQIISGYFEVDVENKTISFIGLNEKNREGILINSNELSDKQKNYIATILNLFKEQVEGSCF